MPITTTITNLVERASVSRVLSTLPRYPQLARSAAPAGSPGHADRSAAQATAASGQRCQHARRQPVFRTAVQTTASVILAATLAACGDSGAGVGSGSVPPSNGTTTGGFNGGTTTGGTTGSITGSTTGNTGGGTTGSTTGSNSGTTTGGDTVSNPGSTGVVNLDARHRDAARFLMQSTFGTTAASLEEFLRLGQDAWLERQFNLPASTTYAYTRANSNGSSREARHHVWWSNAIDAEDQLRQRMAFALSEIFVVSDLDAELGNAQWGIASYYDMLINNAFGNYRELLEQVTLHPAMGVYLSHIRNEPANPAQNIRPDENYAREVLQLFSLGLYELNAGGEPVPAANPRAAYTQRNVEEFARVFTGWNYANTSWDGNAIPPSSYEQPMQPNNSFHDFGEKRLLNGTVLPAGQDARQDLEQALDNIFQHPNVGPFFSRLLIQRLVTSNPSAAYVARVAAVFNNNGAGERGDLQAVVRTLLTDPEARTEPLENTAYGKVREPLIKIAHFFRAFNAVPGSAAEGVYQIANRLSYRIDDVIGQAPLRSPSVFNFFQPDFRLGADSNLVAPEMQIMTETNVSSTHNNFHNQIYRFTTRNDIIGGGDNPFVTIIDLEPQVALARNTADLLDWYDLYFFNGRMPVNVRATIAGVIDQLPRSDAGRFARAQDALFMVTGSPAFSLQR